jgi:stress-induced-phosphoprotein 1
MPNAAAEAKKAKGNDFFKVKDYPNAIKWYTEAIELDPSNSAYYSNRSASYAGLEDWEHAAEDGQSCISSDKTFIKGYFRLATAQESMSNYKKAVETLALGLAVEPRNKDLVTMKSKLEEKLRLQKSQTLQEQAEELQKSGDIAGAFRALEQARAVDAANVQLQAQFDKVKVLYEKAEKSRKSGLSPLEKIKEQGDDKYKNGMFEEAIALYTKCIDQIRTNGDKNDILIKALSNRSACYKQLSNFDATIEDTTAVVDMEPDNVKALVRRAQAFEAVERYKLAIQDVKHVIALGLNVAGQQNYKLCNQMQSRLNIIIEKLKSGSY